MVLGLQNNRNLYDSQRLRLIAPKKWYVGLEFNDKRWSLVHVVPRMPVVKAGTQSGDEIKKLTITRT